MCDAVCQGSRCSRRAVPAEGRQHCSSSSFCPLRLTADVPRRKLPERLEVDPSKGGAVDLANIVQRPGVKAGPLEALAPPTTTRRDRLSEDFVDDPDVPPLI